MKYAKPIYVTKPFLPPLEEFHEYLAKIWEHKQLTNNGPFHQQLEEALCNYLGVKFISLFANGTLALITALQALNITGEVITTPFSFVASSHCLIWNGIKPVFCDIEPNYFTLDPEKIESAITPTTTAILPVHVYGNPCYVNRINDIAEKHGLKVIYDACHTFGVKINNEPILNFGDLSVMSFHATKVFNTFEGGAIICHDIEMKNRIDLLKNFGYQDEVTVVAAGINGKMNEFQSAFGLLQLKYINELIEKRKEVAEKYHEELNGIEGIKTVQDIKGVKHSYSYFPVLIDKSVYGKSRDELYDELKKNNIFGRRYFYPLISQFPTYRELESAQPGKLPIAEEITEKILCLPIFHDLEEDVIYDICGLIREFGRKK